MMTRNAPARVLEMTGTDFDRTMRQYFREKERRTHRRRLVIALFFLFVSLLANGSQLWLYVESLQVCGVRN